MLKFVVLISVLFTPGLSVAQTKSEVSTCSGDGMLAGVFMGHRQNGGDDLTTMMVKFGGVPGLREMILQAYEHPIMLTSQTREMAIDEFQNTWTLRCYREGPAVPRNETSDG